MARGIALHEAIERVLASYIVGGLSAHDALVEISRVVSKDTGEDVISSKKREEHSEGT